MKRKVKLEILQHKKLATSIKEQQWESKSQNINGIQKIIELNPRSKEYQQLQPQLEIGRENLLHEQSERKVAMDLTKEWVKIQNFDEEEP